MEVQIKTVPKYISCRLPICVLVFLVVGCATLASSFGSEGANLGLAVDAPNLAWTTGGAVPWFAQSNITHDGVDAAQGAVQIEHDRSWIETAVNGPGQISFSWKTWTA